MTGLRPQDWIEWMLLFVLIVIGGIALYVLAVA